MTARVAVVGGGLAGLAAALRLASRGVEVVLFERGPHLGGKARELREGGHRFDTGPTVVTLPEVVARTFTEAGAAPPSMTALDPLTRYRLPSGRTWDVHRDPDRTLAGLPAAQRGVYAALLDEARRLYEGAAPTFVHGRKPGPAGLLAYGLAHGRGAHPFSTLARRVRRAGADADLEAFFLRFATYAGADPYRAPAVLLNIAWAELGLGAVHLGGGVAGLVRALAREARARGARLHTGVAVEGLVVEGSRVRAVRTADGVLEVDAVVSAADRVVSHRLLGRPVPRPRGAPSSSGFVLLLGVEGADPAGAHHTVLFPRRYDAEFAALRAGRLPLDPTLYLSVSARSDPADAPVGHENWFVMVNAPPLPDGAGAGAADPLRAAMPPGVRSAATVPFGRTLPLSDIDGAPATPAEMSYAAHLLALLQERAGLRPERLRNWHVVGPRQLAATGHRGSIYGTAPNGLLGALRPAPRVRGVANLVLAGGTVHPGGGIPLVLVSGRHAADDVLAMVPAGAQGGREAGSRARPVALGRAD